MKQYMLYFHQSAAPLYVSISIMMITCVKMLLIFSRKLLTDLYTRTGKHWKITTLRVDFFWIILKKKIYIFFGLTYKNQPTFKRKKHCGCGSVW